MSKVICELFEIGSHKSLVGFGLINKYMNLNIKLGLINKQAKFWNLNGRLVLFTNNWFKKN